jgi:hypothetical protein
MFPLLKFEQYFHSCLEGGVDSWETLFGKKYVLPEVKKTSISRKPNQGATRPFRPPFTPKLLFLTFVVLS